LIAAPGAAALPPTLDRVVIPSPHLRLQCVRFHDATDHCNNLVTVDALLPFVRPARLCGNLLLVQDALSSHGFFLLKESPCATAQCAYPGYDFVVRRGDLAVTGIGVEPADLDLQRWTRCYGSVLGIADGGEQRLLSALRTY